jgi:hypothetical protein
MSHLFHYIKPYSILVHVPTLPKNQEEEQKNNTPKRIGGPALLVNLLEHKRLHKLTLVGLPLEGGFTHPINVDGRIRAPVHPNLSFSVWTQITVPTGKKSGHPRGMPLVTHMLASSEQAWEPMASSSVNFCRKTRTVPSHP